MVNIKSQVSSHIPLNHSPKSSQNQKKIENSVKISKEHQHQQFPSHVYDLLSSQSYSSLTGRGDSSCTVTLSHSSKTLDKHQYIVVIGAMSFIASRLAVYFHENGYKVLAVEDLWNIDGDDMKWYRWTEMRRMKIPLQIIMLSNKKSLHSLLKQHSPQAIIYSPTLLTRKDNHKYGGYETFRISSSLKTFVNLLEFVKTSKIITSIVLLSHVKGYAHRGWMMSFENVLSVYHTTHKQNVAIIKISNVHGPWQDEVNFDFPSSSMWSVDHVNTVVYKALTKNTGQVMWDFDKCTSFSDQANTLISLSSSNNILNTKEWIKEFQLYLQNRKRNVTLGAYLQKVSFASLYGIFPVSSQIRFFKDWFMSAIKHGSDIVVFHDNFNNGFQQRLKSQYPQTETIQVKAVNSRPANDQRFYYIYDYILNHPEINLLVTTDIRDANFPNNPMKIMSQLGDWFFVGLDMPYDVKIETHGMSRTFRGCFDHHKFEREIQKLYGVFNNGVIGGTRSTVLTLLIYIILNMNEAVQSYGCCDMSSLEIVLHTFFFDKTVVGYPFNSAFFTQIPGPFGLAVKHKAERQ